MVWVCGECIRRGGEAGKRDGKLEEEIEKLKRENGEMRKIIEDIYGRMGEIKKEILSEVKGEIGVKIENRVKENIRDGRGSALDLEKEEEVKGEIMSNIERNLTGKVKEEVRDREEIVKREKNVIVHGLKQTTRSDKAACMEIFERDMGVREVVIQEVIRLGGKGEGRDDGRIAPLLVKLETVGLKWAIVGRGKNLRNSEDENKRRIMVGPDLTKKERIRDKELRDELRRRRDNGERGLYINRGQIKIRNNVGGEEVGAESAGRGIDVNSNIRGRTGITN